MKLNTPSSINIREKSGWKVIPGRQQWINAINVSALVAYRFHLLTSSRQSILIPAGYWHMHHETGISQRATATGPLISHAYQCLTTALGSSIRTVDPTLHRLLVMDSHGSHNTANVIVHCMKHAIYLLVLPPQTSRVLQIARCRCVCTHDLRYW